MTDHNSVEIQGRLTRDAEIKYTSTGTALANISIATNYSFKKGEEWENKVSYIDVTVWGKLAERAGQLKKGTPVIVFGRMDQQRWEQDGHSRSKIVIVAEKVIETVATAKKEQDYQDEPQF